MITLTESAEEKILDVLAEENNPNIKLRMFIQGGGCAGFSYGFSLDEEKNEDDLEIFGSKTSILVDSISSQYLHGAVVDYKDDLYGASFTISNPMATSTCGCGSSFSV